MAREISSEIISYDDYYFDGNRNMLIPVSTVVLAEDVLFSDDTNLVDKIESLKAYGTDVKSRAASAVSKISTFTSSDAAWDEIITNLINASKYLAYTDIFDYTGSVQTYTVPVTGTYQIECCGAQGGNYASYKGGKGNNLKVNAKLSGGDILKIIIGGQNGYNRGGTGTISNGGGATDIYINDELLMVAGGGGGAIHNKNGGTNDNVISATSGTISSGNSGNSTKTYSGGGGGGYNGGEAGYYKLCGGSLKAISSWHDNNPSEGQDCYYTTYQCRTCGATYGSAHGTQNGNSISHSAPSSCTADASQQSKGGSNFLNTKYLSLLSLDATRSGNGYVKLTLL